MEKPEKNLGFGPWALLSLIVLGLSIIGLVLVSQFSGWLAASGIVGLIFLSAAMVGALLGFIFAVPRVVATEGTSEGSASAGVRLLGTNTNLEQISDWLATMLVGVGLSQLGNINGFLLRFRSFLEETATVYGEGAQASAGALPAVGPMVLILGAVSGFLLMYLLTRLVLVHFFSDSEKMLSGIPLSAIRHAAASGAQEEMAFSEHPKSLTMPEIADRGEATQALESGETLAAERAAAKASQILTHAAGASTLSNDQALEVMYELLQTPGGYRGVIRMSGELSRAPLSRRADYWFYLASAFGQMMKQAANGSEDWSSARDNAIDCAQRAVKIDKAYRARLRYASDPGLPDSPLSALHTDPDFRRLIGRD